MNRTKNNNSILFLTTLGVYIGLLMAGASPVVIAQQSAAIALNFDAVDVNGRVRAGDDVDEGRAPLIEDLDRGAIRYFDYLDTYIRDLRTLRRDGRFDLDFDTFKVFSYGYVLCPEDNGSGIRLSNPSPDIHQDLRSTIHRASEITIQLAFFGDCLPFEKGSVSFAGRDPSLVKSSKSTFEYDSAELLIELYITADSSFRAGSLLANLEPAFARYWSKIEGDQVASVLQENTSFTFFSNNVIVVTRLPRASLEELLATHAK
ncbi:MAG TPA: hypothetical protein PKD24_16865 [Pyrinomonadaceae bacterium]|nr:hypothetical protein [Pyrinomonadaceae bacterium]HMP66693.1 hypothetical protein [Pyrinomonadaceae bacterium]